MWGLAVRNLIFLRWLQQFWVRKAAVLNGMMLLWNFLYRCLASWLFYGPGFSVLLDVMVWCVKRNSEFMWFELANKWFLHFSGMKYVWFEAVKACGRKLQKHYSMLAWTSRLNFWHLNMKFHAEKWKGKLVILLPWSKYWLADCIWEPQHVAEERNQQKIKKAS